MPQVTVALTFDPLTQKSIEIIYGSWPSMIPRKVYLGEISLKLIHGQDFANARQTDGRMACTIKKIFFILSYKSNYSRKKRRKKYRNDF